MYIQTYIYIHMYVFTYIYIYIYITDTLCRKNGDRSSTVLSVGVSSRLAVPCFMGPCKEPGAKGRLPASEGMKLSLRVVVKIRVPF